MFRRLLAIFRLPSRELKFLLYIYIYMYILDNYMFRLLLAILRLSSIELKILLYTLCAHVVQRSLHTGLIV